MAEITIPAPIDCVWVERPAENGEWKAGEAFYWHDNGRVNPALTGREPIWVMCPGWYNAAGELVATPFCIDSLSTAKNEPWDVTVDMASLVVGQKPLITVHPSIHLIGIWHGWLQDGVLHQ